MITAPRLSNSLLPIGLKQEDESALSIRPVRLKREADAAAAIANNLLAVVDASNPDDEKLGLQPALGFLLWFVALILFLHFEPVSESMSLSLAQKCKITCIFAQIIKSLARH